MYPPHDPEMDKAVKTRQDVRVILVLVSHVTELFLYCVTVTFLFLFFCSSVIVHLNIYFKEYIEYVGIF